MSGYDTASPASAVFSVDVGIRSGMALLDQKGRLVWGRSRNFGTRARLRKGVYTILQGLPEAGLVVLEGGGNLARIWENEAQKRGAEVWRVSAERWREELLPCRMRSNAVVAKQNAVIVAQEYARRCGVALTTAFNDDAAEAVLCGLWAAMRRGYVPADVLGLY